MAETQARESRKGSSFSLMERSSSESKRRLSFSIGGTTTPAKMTVPAAKNARGAVPQGSKPIATPKSIRDGVYFGKNRSGDSGSGDSGGSGRGVGGSRGGRRCGRSRGPEEHRT